VGTASAAAMTALHSATRRRDATMIPPLAEADVRLQNPPVHRRSAFVAHMAVPKAPEQGCHSGINGLKASLGPSAVARMAIRGHADVLRRQPPELKADRELVEPEIRQVVIFSPVDREQSPRRLSRRARPDPVSAVRRSAAAARSHVADRLRSGAQSGLLNVLLALLGRGVDRVVRPLSHR
jgi:hypothetical protein